MDIKITKISKEDVLIFKFKDRHLGYQELCNISTSLSDIIGCKVITLDKDCDLSLILKKED